jgi:thioredoxin reductase (NADPH)
MTTLVVTKDIGGQALFTQHIENYPGIIEPITGPDLLARFWKQAEQHGAKTEIGEVVGVETDNDTFAVTLRGGTVHHARTLILAFGLTPRNMGVPGEEQWYGRGVHSCATCDAPLYKGRTVAVVGGTNAAMDAALLLASLCPTVHMVYGRDKLVGDNDLVAAVGASKNIIQHVEHTVTAVQGADRVTGLAVHGANGDTTLAVDGIFVELGSSIKTQFVQHLVAVTDKSAIFVDKKMHTSREGVFACGDVTDTEYRQIVTAAGEGAIAALEAYKYLQKKNGARGVVMTDWT